MGHKKIRTRPTRPREAANRGSAGAALKSSPAEVKTISEDYHVIVYNPPYATEQPQKYLASLTGRGKTAASLRWAHVEGVARIMDFGNIINTSKRPAYSAAMWRRPGSGLMSDCRAVARDMTVASKKYEGEKSGKLGRAKRA